MIVVFFKLWRIKSIAQRWQLQNCDFCRGLPPVFRASSAVQAKLFLLIWGRPVATPRPAIHPVEPPEAHSAGRQAPQLEMEPVAPNDFRGVFRGASAVACRQNLEAGGPVCFWIHDFRGGLPRIFRRAGETVLF